MTVTPRTSPSAESGFTLVELMIAMLVMTVGLLGLLQTVTLAYGHSLRNRYREQAQQVGEEQMHQLRRMVLDSSLHFPNTTTAVRQVGGGLKPFRVTRDSRSQGGTWLLTVGVTWWFKNVSTTQRIYTLKKKP